MKKVNFIEPFASIQGSATAAQRLVYARDNNAAWYSPKGQRNYARNYHATYIVKVNQRTGQPYLVVKGKFAVGMTDAAIMQMAAQGGAAAVYNSLMSGTQAANARAAYQYELSHGTIPSDWTIRKYWWDTIYAIIRQKQPGMTIRVSGYSIRIDNPWIVLSGSVATDVSAAIKTKFWLVLGGDDYKTFSINDRGIKRTLLWDGHADFGNIMASTFNVLNLTSDAHHCIMYGDRYVNVMQGSAEMSLTDNDIPVTGMFTSESSYH